MITLELAQKLKTAGFPQTTKDGLTVTTISAGGIHLPTLSELIEECGEGFIGLVRFFSSWRTQLTAYSSDSSELPPFLEASTPEDAVALLYLALHQ